MKIIICFKYGFAVLLFILGSREAFAEPSGTPAPPPPPVCTTYTVCDYTTAYCAESTASDPANPHQIHALPFSYSKTDPNPVSRCTGDNGTVSCHGGSVSQTVQTLPASNGYCTFQPNHQLPMTAQCVYRTSQCTTSCTQSHEETVCTPAPTGP